MTDFMTLFPESSKKYTHGVVVVVALVGMICLLKLVVVCSSIKYKMI